MIDATNEFETIPAFEILAGSSFGTWSLREVAAEMISNVSKTTQVDTAMYWQELASATDNDLETMEWVITVCMEDMNTYSLIPDSCCIEWTDNEIVVMPYIDDEIPRFEDVPDSHVEDVIYQISDHGNCTCYRWDYSKSPARYVEVWAIV